jgi:hypothetical protein
VVGGGIDRIATFARQRRMISWRLVEMNLCSIEK